MMPMQTQKPKPSPRNHMKAKLCSIHSVPAIRHCGKTVKTTTDRSWVTAGTGALFFLLLIALFPARAQAQCKRWNVSGVWELRQSNGIVVEVILQQGNWEQQSANLTGTGTLTLSASSNSTTTRAREERTGVITGNITDNAFTILLKIDNAKGDHTENRFMGTIGPS